MLMFENGVIIECPYTFDESRCLSFQQLKGMIVEGHWIELIREVIREDNNAMSQLLSGENYYDWIQIAKAYLPSSNIKDLEMLKYDDSHPLGPILANTNFVDVNWERIGEELYHRENTCLKGSIIYMMTFSDGEEAVKCRGYY